MLSLVIYICGSSGPWDEYNPFYVASMKYAKEVMYLIARGPMKVGDIVNELGVSRKEVERVLKGLEKINAIKKVNDKVKIKFPVFFKEDMYKIDKVTEYPARELAERVLSVWNEVERLLYKFSCASQVRVDKIAFAVVGAYVLDLTGLEVLREKKLAICGTPQPGGRRYTLYGREKFEGYRQLISGIYWGCHSSIVDNIGFYSFGDHSGKRYSLTDVPLDREVLGVRNKEVERKLRLRAASMFLKVLKEVEVRVQFLVESEIDEKLLKLLKDMGYILINGEVRLNYPVFIKEDNQLISEIKNLLKPVIERSAIEYRSLLKRELSEITPLKEGHSIELIYNDLWHWIFGKANKILAERGYLYNPSPRREGEGRYMAWVHESCIYT